MQPVGDKSDILCRLRDSRLHLKLYGIQELGLFGSFSRSGVRPGSDVDFVVRFTDNSKDFYNFMSLACFLEDTLNRKVDLLTVDSLPEHFRKSIEDEIVCLEI